MSEIISGAVARTLLTLSIGAGLISNCMADTKTIALWLFDEQIGIYPSCVLNDASPNDYPMVLGPGGQIVKGLFGNALEPIEQPPVSYPTGSVKFGLASPRKTIDRPVEPMTWMNANFCALMTRGEDHLRKKVGFVNATRTDLNLGAFDWTVEFWYAPTQETNEEGTVFEVGQGPRGENTHVTRLTLSPDHTSFILFNEPSHTRLIIPSNTTQSKAWHHLAFVYSASERQLRHYFDGVMQSLPKKCELRSLDDGDESYFSVGRDGLWRRPLPGKIDELRFSKGQVYTNNFKPPGSFALHERLPLSAVKREADLPLLFGQNVPKGNVIDLGSRKHLFIDDAIVSTMENVTFSANPPCVAECVIPNIRGPFRKHLSVIEDESGLIRLYYGSYNDYLAVMTSRDGIHWKAPDLGRGDYHGARNIVIPEQVGMGNVFIDPNAPSEARWKYVSGFHDRGIYVYYSSDGWSFTRVRTAALPFRSGSQSNVFYDDQRQLYVGYHRSDYAATPAGVTQREFVMTETQDILRPWPFSPVTQAAAMDAAKHKRLHNRHPWYLDNGPLTPGGFGIEYPRVFAPDDSLDPVGADVYVPKAMKYPWAPDTYLAFPAIYFHYKADGPLTRQILAIPQRELGSGPLETQLAVSRDGIHWTRYPRPAYIGIGRYDGEDIHQTYTAHGMVRRGDEIWQYFFGDEGYHSSWKGGRGKRSVFRTVQRLDGFVSADTLYDRVGIIKTRPLRFKGNRLILNIDTDAAGYTQVGFLDEHGRPIQGYAVNDCIYINGDFTRAKVEWLRRGKDVSPLEGRVVQIVFRMRGAKLYAMQFARED